MKKDPLAHWQVKGIVAAAPEPWCRVFTLCWETGARIGEITNLRWEQVVEHEAGLILEIRPTGEWRPKRPASVRGILLPTDSPGFRALPSKTHEDGLCEVQNFEGPGVHKILGCPPGSSSQEKRVSLVWFPDRQAPPGRSTALWHLRRAARRSGAVPESAMARLGTHSFRRGRITQSLEAGADPNVVARAVGHASLHTTLGYVANAPILAQLPPSDQGAVPNPAAAHWAAVVRPKEWRK